ncbi:MAG: hypothetical protein GF317_19775 [Candidatus Lokiarchaeota archaeon]|nr:hypothetical protein [Candidatus Lokiarchaeota archaeon]MBD3201734.1 hypothetical protein [Candidatus Lokiarchaeota archaeon]
MVSEFSKLISFEELYSESTDHFLQPFQKVVKPDIHSGMELNFELHNKKRDKKISPILYLAKLSDAEEILDIYNDIYQGTYPYKEMECLEEIEKMITSSNYRWLLFRTPHGKIAGCFTYQLDFEKKHGYMRGFNIKKKYQGKIDAVKAVIGSMIGIWNEYHGKICIWYCENRTAHTKSQYLSIVCGIKPIAILPNKDIFFNEYESDILHVAYNINAIGKFRSDLCPKIIPEVEKCFNYSDSLYNLGYNEIITPNVLLNHKFIKDLENNLTTKNSTDRLYYKIVRLDLNNGSYLKFLFNPQLLNIEKIEYKVSYLEEFYLLIQELRNFINKFDVRYCEIITSAYNVHHQQILSNLDFKPRGYIPSWNFNNGKFEDSILFNCYKGSLNPNIKLLRQSSKLLSFI